MVQNAQLGKGYSSKWIKTLKTTMYIIQGEIKGPFLLLQVVKGNFIHFPTAGFSSSLQLDADHFRRSKNLHSISVRGFGLTYHMKYHTWYFPGCIYTTYPKGLSYYIRNRARNMKFQQSNDNFRGRGLSPFRTMLVNKNNCITQDSLPQQSKNENPQLQPPNLTRVVRVNKISS